MAVATVVVTPTAGGSGTAFRVSFTAPATTGVHGRTRVFDEVSMQTLATPTDCVGSASVPLLDVRRGQRVQVRLDPRLLGGRWCRGIYRGQVLALQTLVCPHGSFCPTYVKVLGVLGRFSFTVGPVTDRTPPTFSGLERAFACTPGPQRPGLCDAFLLRHSERGTHFAPRTLDLRRQQLTQHVIPLLGSSTLVTAISAADLRRMIIGLAERGLSGATIRACASSASAVFSYGVRELGVLKRNPVRDLERGDLPSGRRQTEPRYLSMEEVELLLDTMTATSRPIAAVCYFAGLRISEALSLKWADIDIDKRRLSVRGTKTRASNATVPLVERLARELIDHRERQLEKHPDRTTADSLVFQTANGRSPVRQNVGRAVSRAANKAGLVQAGEQPVSPHDLRHSFASLLLTSGFSLPEAARLMRHANTQITATAYAGLSNDAIEALTSKLEHATSEPVLSSARDREPELPS